MVSGEPWCDMVSTSPCAVPNMLAGLVLSSSLTPALAFPCEPLTTHAHFVSKHKSHYDHLFFSGRFD
eukprot:9966501-Prorocentrum_lima.AAC.1